MNCKMCVHEKVCDLWRSEELQDASCFSLDGCDYYAERPAADVEPVRRGKWIQSTEECGWSELECAECSECGEDYVLDEWGYEDFSKFMNYCPNCGAKMDKDKEK